MRLKHLKTHLRLWSKFIPPEWDVRKASMPSTFKVKNIPSKMLTKNITLSFPFPE